MPKVKLVKSKAKNKKYSLLVLYNDEQSKPNIINFGDSRYSDYTKGATDKQRDSYRSRHKKEKGQKFDTAGRLSYDILWGDSRSIKTNFDNYVKKFNLKRF